MIRVPCCLNMVLSHIFFCFDSYKNKFIQNKRRFLISIVLRKMITHCRVIYMWKYVSLYLIYLKKLMDYIVLCAYFIYYIIYLRWSRGNISNVLLSSRLTVSMKLSEFAKNLRALSLKRYESKSRLIVSNSRSRFHSRVLL